MSPITLADARTASRVVRFCLAVVFCLFVSVFSPAQRYRNTETVIDIPRGSGNQWLQMKVKSSGRSQISVTLSPASAQLAAGAQLQFAATVTNTSRTAVVWSTTGGSISNSGLLTAPMQAGTVVVTATTTIGNVQASAAVSVSAPVPALKIATSSLAGATVGTPYAAGISAQGGTQPYSWSLNSGTLPNGLTLNTSTGVVSGTASQSGNFNFTAQVRDASSQTSTQQLALTSTATAIPSVSSSGDPGSFDGPAELPRLDVQSTLANTPAPGNTIFATAGSNLQTILNSANCGDTIELQAGATFVGSVLLRAKSCDDQHWIILRSSSSDTTLPAEGTRITPCYAGVASLPGRPGFSCSSSSNSMAKLVAAKGMPTIRLDAGANHYRLGPGLEITRAVGDGYHGAMIGHVIPVAQTISNVVIDRDWIHGTATDDTARGINLDAMNYVAIVDSYINDFHCGAVIGTCTDAQAISGGSGFLPEGPWKIDNNFLESAAENILFGGSGGSIVPTDITITHNHFFKPMIWMPGQPGFIGVPNADTTKCVSTPGYCPFIVKNLFELKNAQRVLFEGNILENSWAGFTQHAGGILLMATNQGDLTGNTNATVADITVRYNLIAHTGRGLSIADTQGVWGPAKLAARFSIHDDLFEDISSAYANGDNTRIIGSAFQISNCATCAPLNDVSISHVTMLLQSPTWLMILGASTTAPIQNITFMNNIVTAAPGLVITGTDSTTPCGFYGTTDLMRINNCLSSLSFVANGLVGASGNWPAGNYFPPDTTAVGFADYNGGDYHLMSTSPYKNAGSDGKDLGADIDAISQATTGVQ